MDRWTNEANEFMSTWRRIIFWTHNNHKDTFRFIIQVHGSMDVDIQLHWVGSEIKPFLFSRLPSAAWQAWEACHLSIGSWFEVNVEGGMKPQIIHLHLGGHFGELWPICTVQVKPKDPKVWYHFPWLSSGSGSSGKWTDVMVYLSTRNARVLKVNLFECMFRSTL